MPRNPNAERDNPCLREQEQSFKCLSKYNYDKEKCEVYFANYNNCKDFWVCTQLENGQCITVFINEKKHKVRTDRRAKGIVPYLPDVEERAKIKAEYMKTKPPVD